MMFEEGYRVIEKRVELLKREIKDLIVAQQKEILNLNHQHELVITELKNQHAEDLLNQDALHQTEIKELHIAQQEAIAQLRVDHENAIDKLVLSNQQNLRNLQAKMDEKLQLVNDTFLRKETDMKTKLEENRKLIQEQQEQHDILQVEHDVIKGELIVYKTKSGSSLNVDDFTSKERFLELERIRDAYSRIFSKSWQATKKAIRKEILSQPYEPMKKEK
jgi:hypothetical protein